MLVLFAWYLAQFSNRPYASPTSYLPFWLIEIPQAHEYPRLVNVHLIIRTTLYAVHEGLLRESLRQNASVQVSLGDLKNLPAFHQSFHADVGDVLCSNPAT